MIGVLNATPLLAVDVVVVSVTKPPQYRKFEVSNFPWMYVIASASDDRFKHAVNVSSVHCIKSENDLASTVTT